MISRRQAIKTTAIAGAALAAAPTLFAQSNTPVATPAAAHGVYVVHVRVAPGVPDQPPRAGARVYVDPGRGTVNATVADGRGVTGWLEAGPDHLWLPGGEVLQALLAVLLVLVIVGGLVLWALPDVALEGPGPGTRRGMTFHRTLGVIAALPVLAMAVTGVRLRAHPFIQAEVVLGRSESLR